MTARPLRFRVIPKEQGQMLGHLLARRLPDATLERARDIVRAGGVYIGHVRIRIPSVRVAAGERITVFPAAADVESVPPESLTIVHRDAHFVVLDKPVGVPVIPTRESARGCLSEALVQHLRDEGAVRPYVGVVHRLDRSASGLVLFTTRDVANDSFHRQFVEHTIDRRYRLVVHGEAPEELVCESPLTEPRHGKVEVGSAGAHGTRPAMTRFRRLAVLAGAHGPETLLEASLVTGRTHQVRVHASTLGFPIKGDRKYGMTDDPAERLFLHALELDFSHPLTGEPVHVRSASPPWAEPA